MRTARIEVYRGERPAVHWRDNGTGVETIEPDWRWRFRASNGRIIAQSSGGYQRIRDLVHSLELTWPGSRIYDEGWDVHAWTLRNSSQRIPVTVPEGVRRP